MNKPLSTVSQLLLICVTILSVTYTILQYYSTSEPSLNAVVRGYPHHHLINWTKLELHDRNVMHQLSLFNEQKNRASRAYGIFDISLKNDGDEVAKNVSIVIGDSIGMRISRSKKKEIVEGNTVVLGDIKPGEEAQIISWIAGSTRLFPTIDPDITITHDNGVVELDHRYEIEGFLRFIHKNNLHILLLMIIVPVFMFIVGWFLAKLIGFVYFHSKRGSGETNEK